MWEILGVVVAVIVAISGAFAWLAQRREEALRRDEVALWGSEAITTMQSLVLLLRIGESATGQSARRELLVKIAFDTSTLVERGRMYFRNCVIDDFGRDKEPAYRGYRPRILDPLVVGHQVACRLLTKDEDAQGRLLAVAEDMTRAFVSLIQPEIARSRTASADTGREGNGADLDYLIGKLGEHRVERYCPPPT